MFFEVLFYVGILTKFDQNPENHVKKIAIPTSVRNVQNSSGKLYKPGT